MDVYFNCTTVTEMSAVLHVLIHLNDDTPELFSSKRISREDAHAFRTVVSYLFNDLSLNHGYLDLLTGYADIGPMIPRGTSSETSRLAIVGIRTYLEAIADGRAENLSLPDSWDKFGMLCDEKLTTISTVRYVIYLAQLMTVTTFVHFGWLQARKMFWSVTTVLQIAERHESCDAGRCVSESSPNTVRDFWGHFLDQFDPNRRAHKLKVQSVEHGISTRKYVDGHLVGCICTDFHFIHNWFCKYCGGKYWGDN